MIDGLRKAGLTGGRTNGQRELLSAGHRPIKGRDERAASENGRFVRRQAANRLGVHRESIREVRAALGPDLDQAALLRGENAEAVMLDLVQQPEPGIDYKKAYTLQFVSNGVGLDLRPK